MCHRLYDGKLFLCPHHYASYQLGKVENVPGEYLDIRKYENVDQLVEALDAWEDIPYVETCKYCRLPDKDSIIPAAQQLVDFDTECKE